MSTATLQTRSSAPHPRSQFAFILQILAVLEDDSPPPLWVGPMATDDLAPDVAAYLERHRPLMMAIDQTIEDEVVAGLAAAGVPKKRLQKPRPPEVARVIEEQVLHRRAGLYVLDCNRPDTAPRPMKPEWEVVGAVCTKLRRQHASVRPNRHWTMAAKILNDGIPTRDEKQELKRDHIRRADGAYSRALLDLGRGLRAERDAAVSLCAHLCLAKSAQVEAIQEVYAQARKRAEFAGLLGAELADAVLARHDIFRCIDRAYATLARRERVAA